MTMSTKPIPVPVRKYSKSSGFYLNTKKDFFSENGKLLTEAERKNSLYASQPPRTKCKLCDSALPSAPDFTSHGVGYVFCPACSHLNGCFDDTKAFIEKLYVSEDSDYSKNYIDENYDRRTSDIYAPKLDFMLENVPGERPSILDVGCGSGYFVFAARQKGLQVTGIDVGKAMIDFGNHQISSLIGETPLTHTAEDEFYSYVSKSKADVISAIGVIEHLREPEKFFRAFQESAAKWIYYSVPMFSFSAVLENVFGNVFPRQLSGGHTHLFTEGSIARMNEIIGVQSAAEWRFGTDMMDLYRAMLISLRETGASENLVHHFAQGLAPQIDELQAVFDRSRFCSEIHLLARKA
jgi:SAM-dependent methyltransferase